MFCWNREAPRLALLGDALSLVQRVRRVLARPAAVPGFVPGGRVAGRWSLRPQFTAFSWPHAALSCPYSHPRIVFIS